MTVTGMIMFVCWVVISYLACRIAYNQGRKDKWTDMSKNYICIHKDVKIKPYVVNIDWAKEESQGKKHLTNYKKKCKINHPTRQISK